MLVRRVDDLKDEFLTNCFDFRRDAVYSGSGDKSPCKYDVDPKAVLAANKSLLWYEWQVHISRQWARITRFLCLLSFIGSLHKAFGIR